MGIEAMRKRSNFLWTALTYLLVFLLVFPVLWMVLTGFKSEIAAIDIPPTLFFQPTLDQFRLAFDGGFGAYFFNSVIASLVSTAIEEVSRSEEHTSELQSPDHLVCRLLLEKKKKLS